MIRILLIFLFFSSCSSMKIGGDNSSTNQYETGYGSESKSTSTNSVQTVDGEKLLVGASNNANDDTTELLDTTDEVDNRRHKSRSTLSNFTMYK